MNRFTKTISSWEDWEIVYQDISAWRLLAKHILRTENLPSSPIEPLTPGTNAVFRTGGYVIKIYAPLESGLDSSLDLHTERFATKRSEQLGIPVPRCIASGCIHDKYDFHYMIMPFIKGIAFTDFADAVTAPVIYEHAHIASELFRFDGDFLYGYFGEYNTGALADLCFDGLLIHDFGGDIVRQQIAKPQDLTSLAILREKIHNRFRRSPSLLY